MPSAKNSWSGLLDMLANGKTAIDGLSGNVEAARNASRAAEFATSVISVTSPMKRTPLAGERADQPLCGAVIAHRPAHRIDSCGQRRLRDDPAAPHPLQQIVFGHHAV